MRTSVEKSANSRIARSPKFSVDCMPFIFSLEEIDILEKKGHIMKALWQGRRSPASNEEKLFVRFLKGQAKTNSVMETAWSKYMNRKELEASLLETEEVYREYMSGKPRS